MNLESRIMEDLKAAMKSKDEAGLRTLRAIKAAILVEKTAEGAKAEMAEADEMKMLQKMAKQRRDSLGIFTTQGRADLAVKEEEELRIIERFLPQQLSEADLRTALQAVIAQVGATGPTDMGKVMGAATKTLAGRADGKAVSAMVKSLLGSQ